MNRNVETLIHKGRKILYSDYSGIGGEDLATVIRSHYEQHREIFEGSDETYLFLTNIDGAFADREVMKLLKETIKQNRPYVRKSAVFGVARIQQVLLKAVNVFCSVETEVFNTKEEAMDWLVT